MDIGQISTASTVSAPTRITLRQVAFFFVVVGLLVSGYLSYVKLTDVPMICVADGPFNCSVVQNSAYSKLFGIPIAWMGFATYILLGALLLLENRSQFLIEQGRLITFGVTLFAWVYSMWLVYVQFFVLEALCPWCLAHEANITVLLVVISARLIQSLRAN